MAHGTNSKVRGARTTARVCAAACHKGKGMGKTKPTANAPAVDAEATPTCPNTGKCKGWVGTDIVRLVIGWNPKVRASRKRFACYVDKATVADYKAACKALPKSANGRYAGSDLPWDTERGFIAVFPAGHPSATADIAAVRAVCKPPNGVWPGDPMR